MESCWSKWIYNNILNLFLIVSHVIPYYKNLFPFFKKKNIYDVRYANNEVTPPLRRQQILTVLKDVFESPQSVVDLYYNYDNLANWSVFERIVTILGKIAENANPPELLVSVFI